jgi:tetratricopeptide (TPR) repeat protein
MLVIILIYIFFALGVGSIGSGRKIGFLSAFIFSLILSPLIGWLITLAYPKIEKTRNVPSPYINLIKLGMNSYYQGNYEASIKIFNDAILRYNTRPEAYLRLGAVYAKQEHIDLAIKNVAKAKSLGIKSLELLNKEPFDNIRSKTKWIEFVDNDYKLISKVVKSVSSADELLKLGELLDKGLITQEEFEAQKQKILNS